MISPAFFAAVRDDLFRGSLPDWQRGPMTRLIEAGEARSRSPDDIAYVLATAYHETGRFRFMEEIGEGDGRDYAEPLTIIRGERRRFHGRGFVQITWARNYAEASIWTGVNLVADPDRAKDPAIAAVIIWEGMIRGAFTGVGLADCRGEDGALDFVRARRIVNGTDRDELIAGYADTFLAALAAEPAARPQGCEREGCPLAA